MSALRPRSDGLVRSLIHHLTGFEPEEENFQLCHAFATSNLLYHHYFEPEGRALSAQFEGLRQKLQIHVERAKERQLAALLEAYHGSPVFREPHPQHDIRIRLLSLLWHLAQSPLHAPYQPQTPWSALEPPGPPPTDWHRLLAQGEPAWVRLADESDLSEWSDSDSDPSSGAPAGPVGLAWRPPVGPDPPPAPPRDWLEARVQPRYWLDPPPDGRAAGAADDLIQAVSRARQRQFAEAPLTATVLSEAQCLRDILWSLRCPSRPSPVLWTWDDSHVRFNASARVCLGSVTSDTLEAALQPLARALSQLRTLHRFIRATHASHDGPFTFEAYAHGLSQILHDFSRHVLALEERLTDESRTFTWLDLQAALAPWLPRLAALHGCHRRALARDEPAVDAVPEPNWSKSLRLIAVLEDHLQSQSDTTTFHTALNLLLQSVRPYFRIIDLWLSEGRLEDFRDEFVFAQVSETESSGFWRQGFLIKPPPPWPMPALFRAAWPQILAAGKSIEILTVLDKKFNTRSQVYDQNFRCNLYENFIRDLKQYYRVPADSLPAQTEDRTDPGSEAALGRPDHAHLELDPYLALAFETVYAAAETSTVAEPARSPWLITGFDPLQPVCTLMERSFGPHIHRISESSCAQLLQVILHVLKLEDHLASVRRVFLLEAGDLMFEFTSDIFSRLDSDLASLDSTSVTLCLQDCIGRRFPEESDRFALHIQDELEHTEAFFQNSVLTYQVQWPLNLVLDESSLRSYNAIFLFLLKVKHAIWALQQIRAKSLAADHSVEHQNTSSEEDNLLQAETRTPHALLLHRILLLRSWLFHFVGNIHSYFMTRVLHSTELELKADLDQAKDLDEVILAHESHIARIMDRCFLHSSAKVLKEAVAKVLKVCLILKKMCQKGLASVKIEHLEALEETYSRSHHFLASTLSSMTQKRNIPHLDGLAVALIHSCPTKV